MEDKIVPNEESKDEESGEFEQLSKSPNQSSRPTSMVFKANFGSFASSKQIWEKPNTLIPAHIVAEAISTLHGLDLRWSGPITPSEMQYVEQYVFAKYPQYCNGLVEVEAEQIDIDSLSIGDEPDLATEEKRKSPKNTGSKESSSASFSRSLSDLDRTQLEPSRLLDILTKKSSPQGNFISIPEIQARNRALKHCGLKEDDYLVLFMPNYKDAMVMIGESYPFLKGCYYMTILNEDDDKIKEFAASKEAKIILAPDTWLDLRIKGSQLSQYFRKKCKHVPKGLFSYPAVGNGARNSMHWISEAHRNSWHVLLDATGLEFGEDHHLALALHRPDFVLCTLDNNAHVQPSKVCCLLVRRKSFDTMATIT